MNEKKSPKYFPQKLPTDQAIQKHFNKHDKAMAKIIKQVGPIQLKQNKKYFFVLCRSIISQQISTKAADAIMARFMTLFPNQNLTPKRAHETSNSKIREAGISKQKSAYIKDLSDKFLNKSINPRKFQFLGNEEIIENLTQVYGVGRWTAEMFLIFSLGRPDVFPVGDLGVRTAIKKIYKLETLPSVRDLKSYGEKWAPFESIGTWYAWRSLNPEIVAY
jgi:DNA-3-methyladenine glycosylase II|tara:strand:+ start:85 stop:741 length:657 start_codon:yes stop_codon:yes gene_type:complete